MGKVFFNLNDTSTDDRSLKKILFFCRKINKTCDILLFEYYCLVLYIYIYIGRDIYRMHIY